MTATDEFDAYLGDDNSNEAVPQVEGDEIISVDFSKVDKVPSDGLYIVEVTSSTHSISSNGNPMLGVSLEVIEDELSGEFVGCFLYQNLMLKGGLLRVTKEALVSLLGTSDSGFRPSDLVGKQAKVQLKQQRSPKYGLQATVARWL